MNAVIPSNEGISIPLVVPQMRNLLNGGRSPLLRGRQVLGPDALAQSTL